jgi:hypothetical protein
MRLTRRRVRATLLLLAVLLPLSALGPRPARAGPPQHARRHLTAAPYNLDLGAWTTASTTCSPSRAG